MVRPDGTDGSELGLELTSARGMMDTWNKMESGASDRFRPFRTPMGDRSTEPVQRCSFARGPNE